jgi:DNA-binding transcriptional regulator YbjK
VTTPRIQQVGDAAIAVLASQGPRGLTHRAVDQAAGLPPGTTSNYARTRAALLTLSLARIADLDAADGARELAGIPLTRPGLADGLARMLHRMVGDRATRQRMLARFELAFEATRWPELRAAYDDMGADFRGQAARLLAAVGATEPGRDAWTLIAWLEGTAFYAIAGAGSGTIPPVAKLRAQLIRLLAGMCDDDSGAA